MAQRIAKAEPSERVRKLDLAPKGIRLTPVHRSLKAVWINLHDRVAADPVLDVWHQEGVSISFGRRNNTPVVDSGRNFQ